MVTLSILIGPTACLFELMNYDVSLSLVLEPSPSALMSKRKVCVNLS